VASSAVSTSIMIKNAVNAYDMSAYVQKSGQNEVMRHGTNPDDITLIFTILRQ
jgi:hypothetical protein